MKRILLAIAMFVLALGISPNARAQGDVTVIAPGGMRAAAEKLIPGFEQKTGYKVKATFGSGNGTKQQVTRGDVYDASILQPPYPEVLASGNVIESSATPLATIAIGIAIKPGAPKPDISTPEAGKKTLLAAKSVSIPDTATGAAAGASFDDTMKRLGITAQMEPKLKRAPNGSGAMTMVANGEVEMGLTFLSEMENPGIETVGPLPVAISPRTALVGLVSSHAKNAEGAKALLKYFASPDAAAIYKSVGMVPGR